MKPEELHRAFEAAFNAKDVDGLLALYEGDAQLFGQDGTTVTGHDAIREVYAGFVALEGTITLETRFAVEQGEVALLSNEWTFAGDGFSFSAITAEVARRQADGLWKYLIDNPNAVVAQPT